MTEARTVRVECPICSTVLELRVEEEDRSVAVQCGPCGCRFEVHLSEADGYDTLFQPQILSEELAGGAETLPIAQPAAAGGKRAPTVRASMSSGDRRYELSKAVTVFGGDGADVVLDDETVSPRHFAIEIRGKDLFLRDLESHEGTFLNGVRVRAVELSAGDEIQAGETQLLLHLAPADA